MIEGLHINGHLNGIFARWYENEQAFYGRPALFLDRDGVIVEETHYLSRVRDISFIPGVGETFKIIRDLNIPVIVITNQAGIGKGYYGWEEFLEVQNYINDYVSECGGFISACVACPYHPEGNSLYRHVSHPYRKPNPGMIMWARESGGIDIASSWLVGDKLTDLMAGDAAGMAGVTHVLTGHGKKEIDIVNRWALNRELVLRVNDVNEAVSSVINKML